MQSCQRIHYIARLIGSTIRSISIMRHYATFSIKPWGPNYKFSWVLFPRNTPYINQGWPNFLLLQITVLQHIRVKYFLCRTTQKINMQHREAVSSSLKLPCKIAVERCKPQFLFSVIVARDSYWPISLITVYSIWKFTVWVRI